MNERRKERRSKIEKNKEERKKTFSEKREETKKKLEEQKKARRESLKQKKDEEIGEKLLNESLQNESIVPIDESDTDGSFLEK